MGESFTTWLHLLAITIWIGPQFLLFLVTAPALRAIEDAETRLRVMRIIIYRYGWLAWGAMAVIVATGISKLFQEANDFSHVFDGDYRYFNIFSTKMTILGITLALTAVHTFIIGPRQVRLHEEMRSDSAEALRLRRWSIALSSLAMLGSLAVLFAGALLANHEFSFQTQ
jgi:putative copper resistance protein D